MGLRTPSRFKTFGAQAKAGAEKQKEARENLMQPGQATQSALGGRASAGTAMVANTTGAQQAATQKVQETQTQATKDLVVDPTKLGTATVTAIAGNNTQPAPIAINTGTKFTQTDLDAAQKAYDDAVTKHRNNRTFKRKGTYNAMIAAEKRLNEIKDDMNKSTMDIDALANTGDINKVQDRINSIDTALANTNAALEQIDEDLKTATEQDAQKLQAEKDRLIKLREEYVNKRKEENLGQIAGQSQAEIDAERQAILLAERGPSNVSKLATVFGKRSAMDPALASQIYGKDLEALQTEAAGALSESERAKIAAGEADEQYLAQLDASKKAYEEQFEDEDRKLELLKSSPGELKGVTQEEVEKLYGVDLANKLFTFTNGYISDTKLSQTRTALEERASKLKAEKDKGQAALDTAKNVTVQNLTNKYFPTDPSGIPQESYVDKYRKQAKIGTTKGRMSKTTEGQGLFRRSYGRRRGHPRTPPADQRTRHKKGARACHSPHQSQKAQRRSSEGQRCLQRGLEGELGFCSPHR